MPAIDKKTSNVGLNFPLGIPRGPPRHLPTGRGAKEGLAGRGTRPLQKGFPGVPSAEGEVGGVGRDGYPRPYRL